MKICVIKDEASENRIIGYLFYYEKSKLFFIELSEEIEERNFPILFSAFVQKGLYTLDPEWSSRWVSQRVTPTDRQNLGMILRENGLKEYDPFQLLILSEGRCAQDDCAVFPVTESQLPNWVIQRKDKRLEMAVPIKNWRLFLVFRGGSVRVIKLKNILKSDRRKSILLKKPEVFQQTKLLPGGHGVFWGEDMVLMSEQLYRESIELPIDKEELCMIQRASVLDTSEVCEELNCSRQYVNQLVLKKGLPCLKIGRKIRLFARGDIERMKDV